MIKDIKETEFEKEVLSSDMPVVVDFWAEWCGPCKSLGPILEDLAKEQAKFKFVKVNIDDNPNIPVTYGIRGIPTLMVFKGGKNINEKVGAHPKDKIIEWLDSIA